MDNLTPQNKTDVLPFYKFTGIEKIKTKTLILGKNGVGKTYCVRDIVKSGKKVLFISIASEAEGLTSIQEFNKNNDNIDIYVLNLQQLKEFANNSSKYVGDYDVVFIDSITALYSLVCIENGLDADEKSTTLMTWGKVGTQASNLYRKLLAIKKDIIFIGHTLINDSNRVAVKLEFGGQSFINNLFNPLTYVVYMYEESGVRKIMTKDNKYSGGKYEVEHICKKRDPGNKIPDIINNITELWSEE